MPDFLINRLVAHGADKMFDLVADVERYPEFVPFCQRQVVRSHETRGDIVTLTTDMTVAHLVFRETFRSRVTLDRGNGRILIAAADGLVRRLHGRWDFLARNAGRCEVGCSLSFELARCSTGHSAAGIGGVNRAHRPLPRREHALQRAGAQGLDRSPVFARSVGMPPHRYVVRLRLQRAMELARDGRSGLAEIAAGTGFADQSHLSRWVRRAHGVSLTQLKPDPQQWSLHDERDGR